LLRATPFGEYQMEDQMLAMLYCYRKRCAPDSPSGQLILPETLRVLPLYTLCAHKMLALRPNAQGNPPDIRADERATRLLAAHNLSIVEMIKVLYPTLYSIHDLPPDRAYRAGEVPRPGVDVPVGLPPTSEKLSSQGVFLLDSGEDLLMYVGRGTSAEVLQELFGVATLPDGEKSS
ncbi:unnamed protein product, partial [Sphacelaria rigidula]